MNIPPLDLTRQYAQIKDEVLRRMTDLCEKQTFILGAAVKTFEKEAAAYLGAKHAIGVASGTDALLVSLLALGISPGDEVITTPFTFIATAEPVSLIGATPVFVDIDPDTFNIDPEKIEKKITKKTKAIIVVHLYGQTADMDPIRAIAKKHALPVIEDTAQAMGSRYGKTGEMAGVMGALGCFSFFPSKNLGCFGDGGLVATNDDRLADEVFALRVHGSRERYYHDEIGVNARLHALQAVVLSVKLPHLPQWLKERQGKAHRYNDLIKEYGLRDIITVPFVEHNNQHTYHQYVMKIAHSRDALFESLKKNGIGANIYYPLPLHRQKAFAFLNYAKGTLPVSETCAEQILSIPIFPELTDDEQVYIIGKIAEFFKT